MTNCIVGCTGFVGSNIVAQGNFTGLFNSKNIQDAYGTRPDLLVYAGLRAEKFIANSNSKQDMQSIDQAIANIEKISPKKLVLISTIDVYKNPTNVFEDSLMEKAGLPPYGYNRLFLEEWVEKNIKDYLIVRLPGLFGRNIKKNFIYDYIHFLPALLNEKKYVEFADKSAVIKESYVKQDNGFYRCCCNEEYKPILRKAFENVGFSALNFTDSRSSFQFYNLSNLWHDIQIALEKNINKLNLATEPIMIEELYKYLNGGEFRNVLNSNPARYDFRSKYANIYGGIDGYLYSKEQVMADIKTFVETYKQ